MKLPHTLKKKKEKKRSFKIPEKRRNKKYPSGNLLKLPNENEEAQGELSKKP